MTTEYAETEITVGPWLVWLAPVGTPYPLFEGQMTTEHAEVEEKPVEPEQDDLSGADVPAEEPQEEVAPEEEKEDAE